MKFYGLGLAVLGMNLSGQAAFWGLVLLGMSWVPVAAPAAAAPAAVTVPAAPPAVPAAAAPVSAVLAAPRLATTLTTEYPALSSGLRDAIAAAIDVESRRHQVDPWLIYAVIQTESGFNPSSRGAAGERGLMQILPATARGVAVHHFGEPRLDPEALFDPAVNIRLGTAYLASLLDENSGDPGRALTAYNTGRAQGAPNGYARKVLARYHQRVTLEGKPPLAVEGIRY